MQYREAYLHQMALYDGLLQKIYPGRDIDCWLVWVDTLDYQLLIVTPENRRLLIFFATYDPFASQNR